MRHILLALLTSVGLAVNANRAISQPATASAQAASPALIEHICRGQDTFTGMVLNPVTIGTSGFNCNGSNVTTWPTSSPRVTLPPLIHVRFKDAEERLKAGDTLTLKGSLYRVNDRADQMVGWLLKDAEIVEEMPASESVPSPGTEAALRRYIESLESGKPNYDEMWPRLTKAVYARTPWILPYIQQAGALKSLRFLFTFQDGISVYQAEFEHGTAEWLIAPLSETGKVRMQGFLPLPASLRCGSGITYMGDPSSRLSIAPWRCQEWGG